MRRTRFSGSFITVWLLNLLLNLQWSIPAWILLALHFWIGLSLWWFCAAVTLWFLLTMGFTAFIRWSNRCSRILYPHKENKNPYSAKDEEIFSSEDFPAAVKKEK